MKSECLRASSLMAVVGASFVVVAACSGEQLDSNGIPSADSGIDAASPLDAAAEDATANVDAQVDPEVPYDGPPAYNGGPMVKPQVIDLATVANNTPVTFTVPPGTLGFHVMVQSSQQSQNVAVRSIQAPSGKFVHQNSMPVGGESPTSETIMGTLAAAQVPQGDFTGATVEPGVWTVVFRGPGTLKAKVQLQNTPDGTFHGGNLNLNVFIPGGLSFDGGPSVNAKGAWARPEVRERIEAFYSSIYELYGLRNGQVRFFDVASKYRSISDQELFTVFKETKVAPVSQAINLFLSEVAPDGQWWGIAAGIPGAANTLGTDQSGIALALVPGADASMEGFVLAHEAGHFMGLNHTTEFDGRGDPLSDTPRCTNITNGDLEACPDFSNIMFASGAGQPPVTSSTFQRRVVQGSPMFQAFATGSPPPAGARMPLPSAAKLDYGRLFGHPGQKLSPAERLVLGATCGHPSHRRPVLTAAAREEVAKVAASDSAASVLRGAARRLLAP